MASLEEVRSCPKCHTQGEMGRINPIPRSRDRLINFECKNPRCKWFNTGWTAQQRPNGTFVDADTRPRVKEFPEVVGGLQVARSIEAVERELEASKHYGAEIKRRR